MQSRSLSIVSDLCPCTWSYIPWCVSWYVLICPGTTAPMLRPETESAWPPGIPRRWLVNSIRVLDVDWPIRYEVTGYWPFRVNYTFRQSVKIFVSSARTYSAEGGNWPRVILYCPFSHRGIEFWNSTLPEFLVFVSVFWTFTFRGACLSIVYAGLHASSYMWFMN